MPAGAEALQITELAAVIVRQLVHGGASLLLGVLPPPAAVLDASRAGMAVADVTAIEGAAEQLLRAVPLLLAATRPFSRDAPFLAFWYEVSGPCGIFAGLQQAPAQQ